MALHAFQFVAPPPSRKTPARDQARLGSYPVPPEQHIWWMNRFQVDSTSWVPGGEIKQSFSIYQQKVHPDDMHHMCACVHVPNFWLVCSSSGSTSGAFPPATIGASPSG
eukprot:6014259-Amphidinium_carterae.1